MVSEVEVNSVKCPALGLTFGKSSWNFVPTEETNNLSQSAQHTMDSNKSEKLGIFEFRTKIVWFNAIGFLLMHLAGFYGVGLSLYDVAHGHFGTFTWSK